MRASRSRRASWSPYEVRKLNLSGSLTYYASMPSTRRAAPFRCDAGPRGASSRPYPRSSAIGYPEDVPIAPPARVRCLARLAFVAAIVAGCAGVGGATDAPPTIAVTGTGRVSVRPDTALVTLGAEARAATLAYASDEVARRMAAVLARVKALGVLDADIATVAYSVDPIPAPRRTEEEGTRIVAYRAANVVRLRIRVLDDAGRVLDEAVAAGANVVRGVQFTLADPAAVEARARAEAVRDATGRAQQLAAAAGVRLGELAWLSEGAVSRPLPEPVLRQALALGAGPIEAGQLEIAVTVEARWRVAR